MSPTRGAPATLGTVRSRILPARHRRLLPVLCGVAGLLAGLLAVPAPAQAQVDCAPSGTAQPPADPWQLRRLHPAGVWPLTRGEGVTVAVIDSGVSPHPPMLAGRVLEGRDFGVPDHSGQCDEYGHGTVVASMIAGRPLPGVTLHGMAPAATILPVRVLRGDEPGGEDLPDRLAQAIRYAVDNGADIINLSLEALPSSELESAVDYAHEHDVLLVAAAGNIDAEGVPQPWYPAAYPGVLAVAGVAADGSHVSSSQVSDYVDLAAPGADIYGPAPDGETFLAVGEGTSYATAYVSGTAALVRAYHPDLTAEQVAARLIQTADRPPEGRNDQVGYGVVNPYRAVATLLGARANPSPAAVAPPPLTADPLAFPRRAAGWGALVGAVLASLLLLIPPTLRRGRRRGWRPTRAS